MPVGGALMHHGCNTDEDRCYIRGEVTKSVMRLGGTLMHHGYTGNGDGHYITGEIVKMMMQLGNTLMYHRCVASRYRCGAGRDITNMPIAVGWYIGHISDLSMTRLCALFAGKLWPPM